MSVRSDRTRLRRLAGVLLVATLGAAVPALVPAGSASTIDRVPVTYVHPVGGAVIDPFRAPAHIGAPGNRGLQYDNPLWAPVVAAAAGRVVFAGPVFGSGTVVIEHADGVRTTYNGMSELWVAAGTTVAQLDGIGLAGAPVHFGAKRGNRYLDPQILIDASEAGGPARLVPVVPQSGPQF